MEFIWLLSPWGLWSGKAVDKLVLSRLLWCEVKQAPLLQGAAVCTVGLCECALAAWLSAFCFCSVSLRAFLFSDRMTEYGCERHCMSQRNIKFFPGCRMAICSEDCSNLTLLPRGLVLRCKNCLLHYRMLSSILDSPHQMQTVSFPKWDSQNYLQTLPKCLFGGKITTVENHWLRFGIFLK